MKRKVCEAVLIMFFYLLQVTFGRAIAIGSISPNFLIILPVLFGFLRGKNEGMYVGLFAGFMYDILFDSFIGFSSLTFLYIGFISGFFYQKYEEREMLIPLAILSGGNLGFGFFSYVGNFLLHNKLDVYYYMSRFVIPEMVYTLLITIILYKPLIFLNAKFDDKSRRRANNFD